MALSTYDTQLLTPQQQAQIEQAKKDYAAAQAAGNTQGMQSAHNFAESIRKQAGYTGLSDGGGYEALPQGQQTYGLSDVKQIDTAALQDWKTAYINQQNAALERAYNDALEQLGKTYNTNKSEYESSKVDTNAAFEKNMSELYRNAYTNNILAQQTAESRGLTSSGQGLAMGTSQLAKATGQAADLAGDRDSTLAKIDLQLNRLSEDYNISKDTLKKNLDLDKIEALSTGELQYITSLMDAMQFNTSAQNDFILQSANNAFTASENQKDRDTQKELLLLELEAQKNNNYVGGYYGGNGYSRSSGSSATTSAQLGYQALVDSGWFSDSTLTYINNNIKSGNLKTSDDVIKAANIIESADKSKDRNTGGGKQVKDHSKSNYGKNANNPSVYVR